MESQSESAQACSTADTEPSSINAALPIRPREPNTHSTFTLFPELPVELRLLVWAYAMPRNRHIIVNTRSLTQSDDTLQSTLKTFAKAPLFRACRESWEVAQEVCKPLLNMVPKESKTPGPLIEFEGKTKILFNHRHDTVIILGWGTTFVEHLLSRHLRTETLQRLCLNTGGWILGWVFNRLCASIKDHCPNLSYFRLLLGHDPEPTKMEYPEQVQLIRIDSNLSDLVHFSIHVYGEKFMSAAYSTAVEVVGRQFRRSFNAFLESNGETWRGLDFDICIVAMCQKESNLMMIRFRMLADDAEHHGKRLAIPVAHRDVCDYFVDHRYLGIPQLFGESYSDREFFWGQGDFESG